MGTVFSQQNTNCYPWMLNFYYIFLCDDTGRLLLQPTPWEIGLNYVWDELCLALPGFTFPNDTIPYELLCTYLCALIET